MSILTYLQPSCRKRTRETYSSEPAGKDRLKKPALESALPVFRKISLDNLKLQFPTAASATDFVIKALKDLPSIQDILFLSSANTTEIEDLTTKSLQLLQDVDLEDAHVRALLPAYAALGISASDVFFRALKSGNERLALKMLELDLVNLNDLLDSDACGEVALFYAIDNNCPRIAAALLSKKPSLVSYTGFKGETPLLRACRRGDIQIVNLLMKRGAKTDVADIDGITPIRVAFEKNSAHLVALLHQLCLPQAKASIDEYRLAKFQRKLGLHYPGKEESDFRLWLGLVNSAHTHPDLGYDGQCMARDLSTILSNTWPEEILRLISASEKEKLTNALKFAADIYTPDFAKKACELIKDGQEVILPVRTRGHTFHLVFTNGYMAICNRGAGCLGQTLKVYRIKDVTEDVIDQIISYSSDIYEPESILKYYYEVLPKLLSPAADILQDDLCCEMERVLSASLQQVGNCTYANLKLALRVAHAMMNIERRAQTAAISLQNLARAKQFSKILSTHIRLLTTEFYLNLHPRFSGNDFDHVLLQECFQKALAHQAKTPINLRNYPRVQQYKQKVDEEGFVREESDRNPFFTIEEMHHRLAMGDQGCPVTLDEINGMLQSMEKEVHSPSFSIDEDLTVRINIKKELVRRQTALIAAQTVPLVVIAPVEKVLQMPELELTPLEQPAELLDLPFSPLHSPESLQLYDPDDTQKQVEDLISFAAPIGTWPDIPHSPLHSPETFQLDDPENTLIPFPELKGLVSAPLSISIPEGDQPYDPENPDITPVQQNSFVESLPMPVDID